MLVIGFYLCRGIAMGLQSLCGSYAMMSTMYDLNVEEIKRNVKQYNALFHIRNEKEKAREYADKLPFDMKNEFWRTITHP